MAHLKKPHSDKQIKSSASLPNEPWISKQSGAVIIMFTSIGMAVLTAIQVVPIKGWLEGIMWGLLFGALIWAIFFGMIFINQLLKR